MNQFKRNKKLALATVLLTVLLLVGITAGFAVSATNTEPTEKRTLNITFDSATCSVEVQYYLEGDLKTETLTESPFQKEIDYGTKMTIQITPNGGYTLGQNQLATPEVGGLYCNGSQLLPPSSTKYVEESFMFNDPLTEKSFEVRCVNRSFLVDYKPAKIKADAAGAEDTILPDISYNLVDDAGVQQEWPTEYLTYKTGNDITVYKAFLNSGYEFKYWEIVNEDGSYHTALESDNKLSSNLLLSDDMKATGKIYLRPVFTTVKYPVIRYDHVVKSLTELIELYMLSSIDGVAGEAAMSSTVRGTEFLGETVYKGYYMIADDGAKSVTPTFDPETGEPNPIIIKRYYLPVTYAVEYDLNYDTTATLPNGSHVFDQNTKLEQPVREGYTFDGWIVTVDGVELPTLITKTVIEEDEGFYLTAKNASYAAEVDAEGQGGKISLKAKWTAKTYTIDYENAKSEDGVTLGNGTPDTHTYDSAETRIPDPTRVGYTFKGWYLNGVQTLIESTDGFYTLDAKQLPVDPTDPDSTIVLEAVWDAKSYTVKLDANGEGDRVGYQGGYPIGIYQNVIINPTFDATVPTVLQLPERAGYNFLGFFTAPTGGDKYINADGTGNGAWKIDSDSAITLYAQWEPKEYEITINLPSYEKEHILSVIIRVGACEASCEDDCTIHCKKYYVNGQTEPLTPYTIKYRETVEITIVTQTGFKVVKWMGLNVPNSASFTVSYKHEVADDKLLTVSVAAAYVCPEFKIDYKNGTLVMANGSAIPNGSYRIYDGEGALWKTIRVTNAGITFAGDATVYGEIKLDERFYGTTISVVRCAENGLADSDPFEIAVAARPAAPGYHISTLPTHNSIEVRVEVTDPDDTSVYQYAISDVYPPDGLKESDWQDASVFENLKPGTRYYVFVRVKCTDTAPNGESTSVRIEVITSYTPYKDEVFGRLDALRQDGDGEQVDKLIADAKAEIEALTPQVTETYYADVEAIYARTESAVPHARVQDEAVKQLTDKLGAMVGSGKYDAIGKSQLTMIVEREKLAIADALTEAEIKAILDRALADMAVVKIVYVSVTDSSSDSDVQITGKDGLSPDTKLILLRMEDLKMLREKVNNAINARRLLIATQGVSMESMLHVLSTQDMMAAYYLTASGGDTEASVYEIRLYLPEDLRSVPALHAAYYNDETGELQMLESTRDGDYLIFTADRIDDFVLFGDPTMDLTVAIIALGATLLLQLIAIIFLLVRRGKSKRAAKAARMYSFAPVGVLTVRFLPTLGLPIVVILGALVIIAQIILVILLLTSKVAHDSQKETPPTDDEPKATALPPLPLYDEESEKHESDPVLDTLTDADLTAEEGETDEAALRYRLVEDTEEEVNEDADADALAEASEPEVDPFAIYDEEPVTDTDGDALTEEYTDEYEDFIEPAVNPRYSLPDEEYAEDGDATEEISEDAEEAWAELDPDAEYAEDGEYVEDAEYVEENAYTENGETVVYYDEETGEVYEDVAYAEDGTEYTEDSVSYEYDGETYDENAEAVYEDSEVLYDENGEVVYEDGEVLYDENGEVVYEDGEVLYDENGEVVYEDGEVLYDENGEVVYEDEELTAEDEGAVWEDADGELPDIDDSYLADSEVSEQMPDIDDSES